LTVTLLLAEESAVSAPMLVSPALRIEVAGG
jgi:hypothetical protein